MADSHAAVHEAPGTTRGLPATSSIAAVADQQPSRRYLLFTGFPFPLGPFTERKTVQTELVKDRVYSFEQEIRLSGISANVRSTVFRMRDNHLLVYNPVAPTDEFMRQLDSLNHAGVAHILLGATPYEHKVFVGPFARKFPDAKVWAVPDQWSFPLDLPASFLGIDTQGSGGGALIDTSTGSKAYANAPDLTSEFEVKLLRPERRLGFGYAANEAAVLHKDSKTLALTDALVSVPATPTPIYDRANLLEGLWSDPVGQGSAAEQMQRGWERNVLLSLFFGPSPDSLVQPDASFETLKDKWVVAPVTDSLIYRSDRVKPELARWVDDVARWDFQTISPSHFAAREGTPDDLRSAFAPTLAAEATEQRATRPYAKGDVRLLDDIAGQLIKLGII